MSKKNKKPPEPSSARDSAMRALGRREHSAEQLRRKLESRGYDQGTAAEAVGELSERGWQSDSRFAEILIRSRVSQGYGRMYIEGDLRVAGVPDAEASAALEAADCDWTQAAIDLHARKFGAAPKTMDERNKQYRYLAGRGFTSDQIRKAMKGSVPDED